MTCLNCKSEMADNLNFCTNCGTPLAITNEQPISNSNQEDINNISKTAENNKKSSFYIIIIIAVLLVIGAALFYFLNK